MHVAATIPGKIADHQCLLQSLVELNVSLIESDYALLGPRQDLT